MGEKVKQLKEMEKYLEETNTMKVNTVESIKCECCGMEEECTPTYISRVKEKMYGKWLCGLCTEAVQEKKRKYHFTDDEKALEAHMEICKKFNSIARVNPNLTLAKEMRNLAKSRSQSKGSSSGGLGTRAPPERSYSCDRWLGVNTRLNTH